MKKLLLLLFISGCILVLIKSISSTPQSATITLSSQGESFSKKIAPFKKEIERESAQPVFLKETYKAMKNDLSTRFTSSTKKALMNSLQERTWDRLKTLTKRQQITGGALVREDTTLSTNEKRFLNKRLETVREALGQFLNTDLSQMHDDDLKIGFVASGGGYRAMILTVGYLSALQEMGLYDALTYISTLSGSTWAVGPMISLNYTPQHYKEKLLTSIQNLNLLTMQAAFFKSLTNINTIVDTIIMPKFMYNQPIRSIDLYGFMLGQALLGSNGYAYYLSDQAKIINDPNNAGKIPFPLYSAIAMSKKDDDNYSYDWYEFGPHEIRVGFPTENKNVTSLYIPTYAFGNEFNGGKTVSMGPEQMLGYYLGIFGSAYSINFKDIDQLVSSGMAQVSSGFSLDTVKNFIALTVIKTILNLGKSGTMRIFPAQVFNFLKGYEKAPAYLQEKEYLTMVDAGLDYNIAARPLLWPLRKVKVLIIGDSSSNVESATELKRFFGDAYKVYGYEYSRIDDGANKTIRLYKDLKHAQAPRIIYINFVKDSDLIQQAKVKNNHLRELIEMSYLEQFDPIECISESFCDTFNFSYSKQDYEKLIGISEFNMLINKDNIKRFLIDELVEGLADVNFPVFGEQ